MWLAAILFGALSSLKLAAALWGVEPDVGHSLLLWYGITEHGLGWLKDWQFGPDNWLLSSVPLHFLGYKLFGPTFAVPILTGWLIFVASALTPAAIAAALGARRAALPIAAALINLGYYAHRLGYLTYPVDHNVTNLFGLLALLCLILWLQHKTVLALAACGVLLALGSMSDPWMTAAFDLPVLLTCLAASVHPGFRPWRGRILAALAVVIGVLILSYTQGFGLLGFVPKFGFQPGGWALMNDNAVVVLKDLGGLLNITPFTSSNRFIVAIVSLTAFALAYQALWLTALEARLKSAPGVIFLYSVAGLSAAGTLSALTIMNAPVLDLSGRYIINLPFFVLLTLGVLADEAWSAAPRWRRVIGAAPLVLVAVSGVIGGAARWGHGFVHFVDTGVPAEAAFLRANGLTYGYGPYWGSLANAVTAQTHEQIRIRPVSFSGGTGMIVFATRAETSRRWYEPSDAPAGTRHWFVMIRPDNEECPDPSLCIAGVTRQFGLPKRTLSYNDSTILVWDQALIDRKAPTIVVENNQRIAFTKTGAFPGVQGWSTPEDWGVWSSGPLATLSLRPDRVAPGDLHIRIEAHGFLGGRRTSRNVTVLANGRPIGTLHFDIANAPTPQTFTAPAALLNPAGPTELAFQIENPESPRDLGLSPDGRSIGLGLEALTISWP